MAKSRPSPPAEPLEDQKLVSAIEHLADEVALIRQVLDEFREDFSWLTRNGLLIRPVEHTHVKQMALDPTAADWNERLVIQRSTYPRPNTEPPVSSATLDRISGELKATIEALAQGQLPEMLTALDEIRAVIQSNLPKQESTTRSDTTLGDAALASVVTRPSLSTSSPTHQKPPPGQLF